MTDYITDEAHGTNWSLLLGDSCAQLGGEKLPFRFNLERDYLRDNIQARTKGLHPRPTVDHYNVDDRLHGHDRLSR